MKIIYGEDRNLTHLKRERLVREIGDKSRENHIPEVGEWLTANATKK